MRTLLDSRLANLIKSQQAFKLNKDYDASLQISIKAAEDTEIDATAVQKRLKDIKALTLDSTSAEWLASVGIFEESYLKWLAKYKVPKFKLTSKDNVVSINVEGKYSELILLETGLQSLLCESYFKALAYAMKQEEGYFYAFATDRFNIKTSGFLNSPSIAIIEDSSAYRPDSDFYSLQAILLPLNNFTYVGTTNPLIAQTFNQPVVTFCDEERWFEGWPDQKFAPSETTFNPETHRGFLLTDNSFAKVNELRAKYPDTLLISKELPMFDIAHYNAHFGNIVWLWGQDLVQDMNIDKYSAQVFWS